MSQSNTTPSMDIIYLKTNFLLRSVSIMNIGRAMCPAKGSFLDNKKNKAVIPCYFHIEDGDLLFLSNAFRLALIGSNTRRLREKFADYRERAHRFTPDSKVDLVRKILSDDQIRSLGEDINHMIWLDGFYNVNIISTTTGYIGVVGDFEDLSKAFMMAHVNKGGYVNVKFDPLNMTSDITYEPPQKSLKAAAQKKLHLGKPAAQGRSPR